MATHVAIVGAGELGQALAHVLSAKKDITIRLWDKKNGVVPDQPKLADLITGAEFVFLSVPAAATREAARTVAPYLSANCIAVGLAKGLEPESGAATDEILASEISNGDYAVLGGPMLAEELQEGLMGAAMVAAKNVVAADRLVELFSGTALKTLPTADIHGVCLCGVLKNIYAVGLGVIDGLKLGANFRAWFIDQAMDEMSVLLTRLGGLPETVYTPAGLDDLIATGLSCYSTNFSSGRELALKGECSKEGEGLVSLPSFLQLIHNETAQYPLLAAIAQIVGEPSRAKEIFEALIA